MLISIKNIKKFSLFGSDKPIMLFCLLINVKMTNLLLVIKLSDLGNVE